MEKLDYTHFLSKFTPFYIDEEFDKQVILEINSEVEKYKNLINSLGSFEGVDIFIKEHTNALKILLSLTDLSSEKFKRIVTTVRMEEGEIPRTEWNLKKIRSSMLQNSDFNKKIINLFILGNSSLLGNTIPTYFLENTTLNKNSLEKLSDEFYLKRILKKVGDGKYNNNVGDRVEDKIEEKLKELGEKYDFSYSREKFVPWIKRNMDFAIPNEQDPYIIIESSFQVTTGSGQTTKRNDMVSTSETIRGHNIQHDKKIAFVNFLDGAGWIGRQADLKRIYNCSDYVINLKTLNLLEDIILKHLINK